MLSHVDWHQICFNFPLAAKWASDCRTAADRAATLWADLQSAMRETRMQDRINYWRPEPSTTTRLIWVATTFTRVRRRSLAYLSVCVLLACVHLHIQNPRGESESQKLHSIKRMREKASPAEWLHIPICIGKSLSLLTLTVCLCYLENTRGGWSGVEGTVCVFAPRASWLMLQIHTNLYYKHYLFFRVSANLVV